KNDVELYREENVTLQVDENKLTQQYQKAMAAMTVTFEGKEQTLQQMARYLEEPKREVRRQAWELTAGRRLREKETFEKIYDDLLELRAKIAKNAGLPSYREY